MAKRQNTGKLTAKPAAALLAPPADVDSADFPDALSFINSLVATREGTEWNCRVYQVFAAGRGAKESMPFLFDVALEDLPDLESNLAANYPAGGTFRVQVRANNALVRNIKLEIAPRPGYRAPPPAWAVQPATIPQAESQPTNQLEMFWTRMAEMNRAADERIEKLLTALTTQKQVAPPTITEQLAMFAEFQKLAPKGAQENGMDLFQKGMDFALKLADARGGGDGTNWLDLIKEALHSPLLQQALQGMATAAAQPGTAALPPPQPESVFHQGNPQAAQAMDTLLRQAQAGVDPKFVAAQIWEKVPAPFMEELEQQPDPVAFIIARFPLAAAHKDWLVKLVAELWEDAQTLPPSPTLSPNNARPANPVQSQT
jgi:hypothetical protein